jgi:hypothetical protein
MINVKNTLFLAATVITVLNFQSCSKYEDGPSFSLRTKKARLVGEWEVVRIGDETYPQEGYTLEMTFEKDGDLDFKYSYGTYSYTSAGDWEFSNDKEELELTLDNEIVTFEILRLTNKEVWLEDESNQEWRLEAQ